jgi:hypothetical protein
MKILNYILCCSLAVMSSYQALKAQDTIQKQSKPDRKSLKAEEVKKLLDNKRFIFQAQYANPLGGAVATLNGRLINLSPNGSSLIYLNYNYDFKIRPDSIIANLPYYGTTQFDAGYNPASGNGVEFTSTKFGYESKTGKKGNTTITITPQDAKYNRKFILEVFSNGNATLQAIITNRNAISYSGYIVEKY